MIPVVDPHHHLWNLDTRSYPWLQGEARESSLFGDFGALKQNYLIDDFLADIANKHVVKSVHVQVQHAHDVEDEEDIDPVDETEWLQGIADEHGYPHGIVAYADLCAPDIESVLERHCAFDNMRGIRHVWYDDPGFRECGRPDVLTHPRLARGYVLLEKFDLRFDLSLNYQELGNGAAFVRRYPNILNILNHIGYPVERTPEALEVWRRGMHELARCPNVMTKISGLAMYDRECTVESFRPFVLETIDIFGVDRCMFASNFPVDKLFGTYGEIYGAYQEIVRDFSEDERRKLLHDTAMQAYDV